MPPPILIPTVALGRAHAGHSLPDKLRAAASHGYAGVELTFECLQSLATERQAPGESDRDVLIRVAGEIKSLARDLGVRIPVLQPFMNFEGLLDQEVKTKTREAAQLWVDVARAVGAEMIQLPSNFLPSSQTSPDLSLIATDFQYLATLGSCSTPIIRFAYEPVLWGTHTSTWEQGMEIVRLVDRENFGLCLDTFHVAGLVWGDCEAVGGKREGGEAAYEASLQRLSLIPQNKIFLFQLSDALLLSPPFPHNPLHNPTMQPGLSWSRSARPFPLDGYLPLLDMVKVVKGMGYEGLWSLEVFLPQHHEPGKEVPGRMAGRGMEQWEKVWGML